MSSRDSLLQENTPKHSPLFQATNSNNFLSKNANFMSGFNMAYLLARVIDRGNDEMVFTGSAGEDTYPKPQPSDSGK